MSIVQILASNVTIRHRSPKRKLRNGFRAPSLQRTSYLCLLLVCKPVLFFIVECCITRFLCACAHYACIRCSVIVLTPRLRGAKFSFYRAASQRRKITYSLTYSISLFESPETEAFLSEQLQQMTEDTQ